MESLTTEFTSISSLQDHSSTYSSFFQSNLIGSLVYLSRWHWVEASEYQTKALWLWRVYLSFLFGIFIKKARHRFLLSDHLPPPHLAFWHS